MVPISDMSYMYMLCIKCWDKIKVSNWIESKSYIVYFFLAITSFFPIVSIMTVLEYFYWLSCHIGPTRTFNWFNLNYLKDRSLKYMFRIFLIILDLDHYRKPRKPQNLTTTKDLNLYSTNRPKSLPLGGTTTGLEVFPPEGQWLAALPLEGQWLPYNVYVFITICHQLIFFGCLLVPFIGISIMWFQYYFLIWFQYE